MSTTQHEPELFNSDVYTIPFQKADGHDVTDLVLRISGSLKLNRNDPDHVALIESLTLGRHTTLTVTASVEGKAQGIRYDADETEVVTHTVGLKIHSAEAA